MIKIAMNIVVHLIAGMSLACGLALALPLVISNTPDMLVTMLAPFCVGILDQCSRDALSIPELGAFAAGGPVGIFTLLMVI